MREKVFERFYRVDNSDRRMAGGTGLGLALVKEIVEAHNGRVWVEPNSPAGSRFLFTIPC
jgi:signal transduction histidine kinase